MALNGQLKSQRLSNETAHTLTWNQASCVHSRISHAVIKSTPVKEDTMKYVYILYMVMKNRFLSGEAANF